VHCLVTLVEGKRVGCHASWLTLQALDCNGVNFRRKYMDHTGDPGCENLFLRVLLTRHMLDVYFSALCLPAHHSVSVTSFFLHSRPFFFSQQKNETVLC